MIKTKGQHDRAQVTFTLDRGVNADSASVCGEFNGWSTHVMERAADGSFHATLELESGRQYRFRYLLDGNRWENDWAADAYVPNEFGGDDSVVDLTDSTGLSDSVPTAETPAAAEAPAAEGAVTPTAKKAPARKAAGPADKATPVKKATAKKAAAKKAPKNARS